MSKVYTHDEVVDLRIKVINLEAQIKVLTEENQKLREQIKNKDE